MLRIGKIGDADLATVEQGIGELVARHVGQADDLGKLAGRIFRRHLGQQFEGLGVEGLDATRRVVLRHDDAPVL